MVPVTSDRATPNDDDAKAPQTSQASRALDVAARVLAVISSLCVELDRRLVGKRWCTIVGVSGLGMLLGIACSLDWLPGWPHMVSLAVFILLVATLAWAQVVVIRFEVQDKGWKAAMRGGLDGLMAMWSSDDGDDEDDDHPGKQQSATQRRAWVARLLAFAVLAYTLASIVGLVPSAAQVATITQGVAIVAVVLSGGLWLHGRQADGQTKPRKFATVSTEATEAEFLALPPMVVLNKATVGQLTLAHRATDELLRELLIQLPRWTPGDRGSEKAYEAALVRFLQRSIPNARIEQQVYLTPDGSRGQANRLARIDLVLDGHIAIELKRLKTKSELDRCVGQIRDYADLWGDRGPLFLLVCESAPEFLKSATAERLIDAQRGATFRVLIAGFRHAKR